MGGLTPKKFGLEWFGGPPWIGFEMFLADDVYSLRSWRYKAITVTFLAFLAT